MKKVRLHLLLMATVAAITFPAVTSAGPPKASGTWVDCNFAPLVREAGPPTIVTVGITQDFSGTLNGTYTGSERDVIQGDGSATFQDGGIFTGTIAGRSGTATFRYDGIAPVGQPAQATWVLEGLTESLDKVKGHGTFGGSFVDVSDGCPAGIFSGTYEGTLNHGR